MLLRLNCLLISVCSVSTVELTREAGQPPYVFVLVIAMPRVQLTVIVPCASHQGILLALQQILLVGATSNVTSLYNIW